MGANSGKESTTAAVDKVDLRDHGALKSTLDEYSVELLKKAGYSIDHKLDDLSSGIAILAILLALVAQFWEKIDPQTKDAPFVLVPCVVGYFALTGVVTYISSYIVKGTIARTKPTPGLPGLKLESSMKDMNDHYTLTLTMGQEKSTRKEYIGKLFNEDGEIQLSTLSAMVNELLHEMDSPSESSNGDSKKEQ